MKLTLCDGNNDNLMIWDLEKQIGDMREPRSRRILYRELIEAIDYQLKYCPLLREVKPTPEPTPPAMSEREMMEYLASLTQEEREEILGGS